MTLPLLREELALLPGPALADGQPGHTLHDPVRNLFFQIDWPSFEILCRWQLGAPDAIARSVSSETTLQLETADVERVLSFLRENQLLQVPAGSAAELVERLKRRKGGAFHWLLHNYLFFRVPLVKPDRWLERWSGAASYFFSRQFLTLTLAALGFGLVEVYRGWERFAATLVDTLSWSGLATYGAALLAVKILHELGHAFTAKRHGCRVPTMGVAFLVLWPVAYTDTNEVWKLTRRSQRLQVAAAGVLTELAVAAWATLAWVLLPDGHLKSAAFLLATTTWVSTLAVNASPFMRFDGYFLLSDWLEMPNLHARAFELARWDLRERLFALGEPAPEMHPPLRRRGLVLFAWATWLYRLALFLGIAALVYAFFIKAVGIFLFAVEIVWFVLLPVLKEFSAWRSRWPALRGTRRARRSALLALGAITVFILPWPTRIGTSALLRPAEQFVVYAPAHARVAALPVAEGARVAPAAVLVQMSSPDLDARRRAATARHERLRWQASAGAFDSEQRAQWQVSQEELATAEAELATINADAARYAPAAPFAGTWHLHDPDLRPGTWVTRQEAIGAVLGDDERVIAYLDEDEVRRIAVGDKASFHADGREGGTLPLSVESIDNDASRLLPEHELSAPQGGRVPVRERKGLLYPEQSIYRVVLRPTEASGELAGRQWRGTVVIAGSWEAPGARFARAAMTVVWRELGF